MSCAVPVGMAMHPVSGQPQYSSFAPAIKPVPILPTTGNTQQISSGFVVGGNALQVPTASGMQQALPRNESSVNGMNQQQQFAGAAASLPSRNPAADPAAPRNA